MSSVPNVASHHPIYLKDSQLEIKFVEFPEDTIFMESLARHPGYRNGVVIVPLQRVVNGQKESHIYEFTPSMDTAKHLCGPVTSPDGSTKVTLFGSAISSTGILYLCAFNRNSILALDLNTLSDTPGPATCFLEIDGLPAPNDVCVDAKNESILYVAGGKFNYLFCASFSNAVAGTIYKIEVKDKSSSTDIQAQDLKTLAGIEVFGNEIWVAQLFNIIKQKENTVDEPTVEWRGYDCNGNVWLADNIDTFGDDMLVCPAYSSVPAAAVDNIMKSSALSSIASFCAQVGTACMHGEGIVEAIHDPEVDLAFSNTYVNEKNDIPAPIRLIFLKPGDPDSTFHFEVDLVSTRKEHGLHTIRDCINREKELGKRHYFNEQVTHAAHIFDGNKGYIACVNFEQPRILLIDDEPFRVAMSE